MGGKHRRDILRSEISDMSGFTIAELLIVIAIIAILSALATFSFTGWTGKYKVEGIIKEMQVDLMNARAKAMQKSRTYFVNTEGEWYKIYEDAGLEPNGIFEPADDTVVINTPTPGHAVQNSIAIPFSFNKEGLCNSTGDLWIVSDADPDFSCLSVSRTRINLGMWNSDSNECFIK